MSQSIFYPCPTTKHDDTWRMTKRVPGELNAIPGSRGVMVATNGILCKIEQGETRSFLGHIAWFVPDKDDDLEVVKKESTRPVMVKQKKWSDEYV